VQDGHEEHDSELSEEGDFSEYHDYSCCESCQCGCQYRRPHVSQGKVGPVMAIHCATIHCVCVAKVDDKITTDADQDGKEDTLEKPKLPTKAN